MKIIGITGTNGKSTTTRMLFQMLQQIKTLHDTHLLPSDTMIHIGGNFDKPLSGILADIIQEQQTHYNHIVVLEVSSFMLRNLHNFIFDIGVFLNIARDHQDRHTGMDDYIQSKENILRYADVAITSPELQQTLSADPYYHEYTSYPIHNSSFLGEHNRLNAGAAHAVLSHLVPDYPTHLWDSINGLPHRLQTLAPLNGITIVDDGISSSAHALKTALSFLSMPFVLVCGGYDSHDDYASLKEILLQKTPIVVVYGQISAHIYPLAKSLGLTSMIEPDLAASLSQALELAKKKSLTHILFSPGAKSFDQFTNVYHRVESFSAIIQELRRGG